MKNSKAILELKNIHFDEILQNVNISLKQGEVYCIIGANGSGKSLLLKIATGLQEPDKGEVIFQGENIYDQTRNQRLKILERIGVLFQSAALISNISIYENIALVLKYHSRLKSKEIKDRVEFFLNELGLFHRKDLMPADISLGEKKLTAFIRAIVNDPDMLILDEPTVLIDKKTKRKMADLIEEYREKNKTILVTSNDNELIFNLSDTVGVLLDSTLKEEGEPYDIKYSDNKQIKELLSSIKVIREEQIESEILKILK